jgi:hypothetical protein
MKQMMVRLLAEMKAEIKANHERLEAKLKDISDKFEILREKWASQEGIK